MSRIRIGRARAVALTSGMGLALFGLSLPTWARALSPTSVDVVQVAVAGTSAAPGVASAALVVVVAGLVLGLAGRLSRLLAALAMVVAGAVAVASTLRMLADPVTALRGPVGQVSGVTEIVEMPELTAWPIVAVVLGGLIVLMGLLAPFLGAWQAVGRRFQSGPATGPVSASDRTKAMDDWDSISRGEDPSQPMP
ncbi:MAG: Trp biosynthesis-associated membrane protein [Beutenbergiaceae bacterium]